MKLKWYLAVAVATYVLLAFGSVPLWQKWNGVGDFFIKSHVESLLAQLAYANRLPLEEGKDLYITGADLEKSPGVMEIKIVDRSEQVLYHTKAKGSFSDISTFTRSIYDHSGAKLGTVFLFFAPKLFLNSRWLWVAFFGFHFLVFLLLGGLVFLATYFWNLLEQEMSRLRKAPETFPWVSGATSLVSGEGWIVNRAGQVLTKNPEQTGTHLLDFVHHPGEAQNLLKALSVLEPGADFNFGSWKGFCWKGRDEETYIGVFHAV